MLNWNSSVITTNLRCSLVVKASFVYEGEPLIQIDSVVVVTLAFSTALHKILLAPAVLLMKKLVYTPCSVKRGRRVAFGQIPRH